MSAAEARLPGRSAPIRVMVVDDSAVVRGVIVRLLEAEPGIAVVATCANGQIAVQQAARVEADVAILDVEMPVMDGLTALPKLLAVNPALRVLMASTLTQRNANISLQALQRGAADYLPKPSTNGISQQDDFRRELIGKVLALGQARPRVPAPGLVPPEMPKRAVPGVKLRTARFVKPQAVVIGSSTGGPQALMTMLAALPAAMSLPVLIAQHMPATFTAILAQHIARATGRSCVEAADGMILRPGGIVLAPGDFHMEVARDGAQLVARLNHAPPENFCRPSVEPLFRSAARAFGPDVCAVMLTGMGSDGLAATRLLAAAGAPVIAQDEASSVVWGMPGAIATAGLCTAVLPLKDIAAQVASIAQGARP